ncbi:unnamed protein product [Amoebophrya sp. A120]|nr:unnamed protein product [Amoebophrya sp. A120]|eukprot:GSA120T00021067001.1
MSKNSATSSPTTAPACAATNMPVAPTASSTTTKTTISLQLLAEAFFDGDAEHAKKFKLKAIVFPVFALAVESWLESILVRRGGCDFLKIYFLSGSHQRTKRSETFTTESAARCLVRFAERVLKTRFFAAATHSNAGSVRNSANSTTTETTKVVPPKWLRDSTSSRLDALNICLRCIHSGPGVFLYDENVRFMNNECLPYLDSDRQQCVQYFQKHFPHRDWAQEFAVSFILAEGAPARVSAITQSLHQFRPNYVHILRPKSYRDEPFLRADGVQALPFDKASVAPAIPINGHFVSSLNLFFQQGAGTSGNMVMSPGGGMHNRSLLQQRERTYTGVAELDNRIRLVLKEMLAHKKAVEQLGSSKDAELAGFWLRKTRKPVLCVLMVEKEEEVQVVNSSQQKLAKVRKFYRGLNLEVSMPTGSLCAERNCIGQAVAADPTLRREHIKLVAVLSLPQIGSGASSSSAAEQEFFPNLHDFLSQRERILVSHYETLQSLTRYAKDEDERSADNDAAIRSVTRQANRHKADPSNGEENADRTGGNEVEEQGRRISRAAQVPSNEHRNDVRRSLLSLRQDRMMLLDQRRSRSALSRRDQGRLGVDSPALVQQAENGPEITKSSTPPPEHSYSSSETKKVPLLKLKASLLQARTSGDLLPSRSARASKAEPFLQNNRRRVRGGPVSASSPPVTTMATSEQSPKVAKNWSQFKNLCTSAKSEGEPLAILEMKLFLQALFAAKRGVLKNEINSPHDRQVWRQPVHGVATAPNEVQSSRSSSTPAPGNALHEVRSISSRGRRPQEEQDTGSSSREARRSLSMRTLSVLRAIIRRVHQRRTLGRQEKEVAHPTGASPTEGTQIIYYARRNDVKAASCSGTPTCFKGREAIFHDHTAAAADVKNATFVLNDEHRTTCKNSTAVHHQMVVAKNCTINREKVGSCEESDSSRVREWPSLQSIRRLWRGAGASKTTPRKSPPLFAAAVAVGEGTNLQEQERRLLREGETQMRTTQGEEILLEQKQARKEAKTTQKEEQQHARKKEKKTQQEEHIFINFDDVNEQLEENWSAHHDSTMGFDNTDPGFKDPADAEKFENFLDLLQTDPDKAADFSAAEDLDLDRVPAPQQLAVLESMADVWGKDEAEHAFPDNKFPNVHHDGDDWPKDFSEVWVKLPKKPHEHGETPRKAFGWGFHEHMEKRFKDRVFDEDNKHKDKILTWNDLDAYADVRGKHKDALYELDWVEMGGD